MKAVCIYASGGPEVLVYEDAPCPHPGEGEVLVRVHAAAINPVDWEIREGQLKAFVFVEPNAAQLAELAKLVDAEKLKAIVETILPLPDAARGQELSQRGHTRGKIVLRVVAPQA